MPFDELILSAAPAKSGTLRNLRLETSNTGFRLKFRQKMSLQTEKNLLFLTYKDCHCVPL